MENNNDNPFQSPLGRNGVLNSKKSFSEISKETYVSPFGENSVFNDPKWKNKLIELMSNRGIKQFF